jgi:hypothetical protein
VAIKNPVKGMVCPHSLFVKMQGMAKEYENYMHSIIASGHFIIYSVGKYKGQLMLRPQNEVSWMEGMTVLWLMSTNPKHLLLVKVIVWLSLVTFL